ncbi:hypothetical protein [Alicyclobacillus pomorum]|uniref:hypothetical protein n=1 Tax=Alicyclobacillus pomorum TaxID=204470 RepID=UPI00040E75FF|nr:hypothetical protein [Alicyclobacillus pomorum]
MRANIFWTYYYLADDVRAYQEGPFTTYSEARRVATEVDRDLYPVDLWIECGSAPVWQQSRERFARNH